jgi:anti-anti-sigma factor
MQNLAENIILVELPKEPEMGDEINTVMEILLNRDGCNAIIDFSNVDTVTSPSLSKMLKLRKLLIDRGNRLVFCNVAVRSKRIFQVTGLDQMFEFVDDKHTSLAILQRETQDVVSEESQETVLKASHEFPLNRLWERNTKTN